MEKSKSTIDEIKQIPEADISIMDLDLSSLSSVRSCCAEIIKQFDRIDILINNAGVMWCSKSISIDGNELHFATNHLGIMILF